MYCITQIVSKVIIRLARAQISEAASCYCRAAKGKASSRPAAATVRRQLTADHRHELPRFDVNSCRFQVLNHVDL